jgi:hypothetical protein
MKILSIIFLAIVFSSCQSDFFKVVSSNIIIRPEAFDLNSATQGNSKIILTWSNSEQATKYIVKYGTTSGSYPTVASTNATSPFEVSGLTNGVEYFFRVEAVNDYGSILSSRELSQTAIFLDNFVQLDLISTWQRSSNPAAYSNVFGDDPLITSTSDGTDLIFGQIVNNGNGAIIETVQNFNFTDSWVSTEMSAPPVNDGLRYQEAGLWVLNSLGDGWEMFKGDDNLTCTEFFFTGGAAAGLVIPFDPIAHRHLRIRHEADDDSINFEASPDGVVWSLIHSVNRTGHPITQLHFSLYAFGFTNASGPSGLPSVKFNSIQSNAPLN